MTQLINEKLKKCCENCHSLLDKPCAWLSLGNEYCDAIMEAQQEIEKLNNELENVKAHYETEAEAKYYDFIDNHESKLQQRIDKAIEEIKSVQKDLEEAEGYYYDWLDKSIQILRSEDNE